MKHYSFISLDGEESERNRTDGDGQMQRILLFAWAVALFPVATSACVAADNWVRFSPDGSQIVAEAEMAPSFRGVSSAYFQEGEKAQRVGTEGGAMIETVRETTVPTPFGDAVVSSATFGAEHSPYRYTLVLKRLKNLRAFTLQAVFHNGSNHEVRLHHFDLLDTRHTAGNFTVGEAAEWLVTPLMESADSARRCRCAK